MSGATALVRAACGGTGASDSASTTTRPGRDDLEPINAFIDDYDVGAFDHIVDETGAIWANFEIVSQPSFVFLDAGGDSTSYLGPLGVDGLSERLDSLTSN